VSGQPEEPEPRVTWPEPRADPPEEPTEPWAKLAERIVGEELVEWKEWAKWR
jgi:hypothetical protein